MHCSVKGKVFAAVMDRQKLDNSLTLNAGFTGLILDSVGVLSPASVPGQPELKYYLYRPGGKPCKWKTSSRDKLTWVHHT